MSSTSQLALVIMAGGHSARFIDPEHKPKEVAVERLFSRIQ